MKKVDDLANYAAVILQDTKQVRWTADQHTTNLNSAIREIIDLRPDAYTKSRLRKLVPGYEQTLDAAGLFLLKIISNMGLDGSSAGDAPRIIDLESMDLFMPSWRNDAANGVVRHYIPDPRTPRRFEVWPPQPVKPHYVRLLQAEYPDQVTVGSNENFPLTDSFANAAVQLSLAHGFQKAVGGDLNRSSFHRSLALQMLGLSGQSLSGSQPVQSKEARQ